MVWGLACFSVETEMTGHRVASSECAAQHAAWPDCGWWFHAFPHPTPFQAAKPPIPYLRVYDVKSVRSILVTGVVRFPTQGKRLETTVLAFIQSSKGFELHFRGPGRRGP